MRHRIALFLLSFAFLPPSGGHLEVKGVHGAVKDTQEAASEVIAGYRTTDPAARVRAWQAEITHPSGNPRFNEFQAERLRAWEATEFAKYRLDDGEILALFAEVVRPVLKLYRREGCFKLIVIEHPAPVAMNDSGVILMFSTGMLARAAGDDELLGHAAHEVGHDLFWRRTARARESLEFHGTAGAEAVMTERQAYRELLKIELECDAFSTITLAAMGRNPLPTARSIEAISRDYPDYVRPDLPPAASRVKVIEDLIPPAVARTPPRTSEAFTKLKVLLDTRAHRSTTSLQPLARHPPGPSELRKATINVHAGNELTTRRG